MRYKSFEIRNFRGIRSIDFNFQGYPASKIFTLVGLNESGKTTLLEALAFWFESIGLSEESFLHTTGIKDPRALIPRGSQFNFTDSISVSANLVIDDMDISAFDKLAKKYGYGINWEKSDRNIKYTINYGFVNSKLDQSGSTRLVTSKIFLIKTIKLPRKKPQVTELEISPKESELWSEFCKLIRSLLQPIIYYPNFLFEFPEKIYIDGTNSGDEKQDFYYRFLQDILDSIGEDLKVKESILDRYISQDSTDQKSLRSLTNRMSSALNVLMKQLDMFDFKSGKRSVIVSGPHTEDENHFMQIQIQESDDTYDIRERSLGFRWFFTFALLTQFRIKRTGSQRPIFLFDEPASNLHQTAQQRLLKSLEGLTLNEDSTVIYATHSHHLINPKFLESTYIVRNEALSIDNDLDYKSSMTDVKIYKYREFVDKNPNDKDYFQPILDVLEYKPSQLENVNNCLIVEGKNDFYTLKLLGNINKKISILPGFGVDKLETIIALYFAWGKNFILLLDSDKAGEGRKTSLEKRYGPIIQGRIFSLSDASEKFTGKAMEDIFTSEERLNIQKMAFPETEAYEKGKFNIAVQECLIKEETLTISSSTKQYFKELAKFISQKLE